MHEYDIWCGISKGTFDIPHKIAYPYIERCRFYLQVKIQELLDLRAHKCFWNAPRVFWKVLILINMIYFPTLVCLITWRVVVFACHRYFCYGDYSSYHLANQLCSNILHLKGGLAIGSFDQSHPIW